MNDDLQTKIKELKEELEKLEKAAKAEDKTLFTITAKMVSQSDKGSHIAICTNFNAEQMALLCYLTDLDVAKAHKGVNELVDKFSNDFAQMVFEQAENVKGTLVEEDE